VVEALIVTHPHTDHYRGAETISRHFDIQHYYDPGFPRNASGYVAFLNAMRGTSGQPPRADSIHIGVDNFGDLNWGSELTAEFLYSWPGSNSGLGSASTAINNSSIVLRLEYGDHVFLFMGDAEGKDRDDPPHPPQYVERVLLETVPDELDATVLKIGHHGSETSSTTEFIEAVDPDIVVVQSGRKPYSGTFIPDASTLQRYCDHDPDTRIYRTDQGDEESRFLNREAVDGDHIVIRTNGTGQPEVIALDGGHEVEIDSCET
jgi:competence protein ComEC